MNKNSLLSATALRSVTVFGLALASGSACFCAGNSGRQAGGKPARNADHRARSRIGPERWIPPPAERTARIAGSDRRYRHRASAARTLNRPLPVTSVGGEEFFETGNVSVGDTLNELPALRSTFSQANSTRFLGTAGLNLLDLRGLGTVRTLVLQNGRRHVGGDVLGERRDARRQHHPDRPDRARRRRDRRQLGRLRFGRHRRRRQLHPQGRL